MELVTKSLSFKEIENVLYARQFAFDILRRFFVEEPSKEYLKQFVQKNMIHLFPFKDDSPEIQAGVNDINAFLATHDVVNIERHYQDLHWDYTRMFIGPFSLSTPPWESSYVRKDGLLFQGTTMEVRKLYEKYGIFVRDFNIEADDHFGLELDFIYHLNELCLQICESNQEADFDKITQLLMEQSKFLKEHLLQFVPQLCNGIISEANTSFFVGLAKIVQSYLKIDLEVLNELLNIDIL
ncbi:molecular chaperone [Bacillus sp. EB600]|uniref:TorD/DmsD family molecular chaperone n=1 Tax=Bacillus sp. EB600 TaxID=2806345 RepID=UPI00210D714F|nr:molecular chaperone TorD family protein [Bacillus sp. EB600]MCQ6278554.1 molecular chaperone TorD family protein [Bacillus sp. EB600]